MTQRTELLRYFAERDAIAKSRELAKATILGPGWVYAPLPPGMNKPPQSCSECELPFVPDVSHSSVHGSERVEREPLITEPPLSLGTWCWIVVMIAGWLWFGYWEFSR